MDPNIGSSLVNKTMKVFSRTRETTNKTTNNKQSSKIISTESIYLLESERLSPEQYVVHDFTACLGIEDIVEVYFTEVFLFR